MSAVDLFRLKGIEPPAGDLGVRPGFSACRSVWVAPIEGEKEAPAKRIIHVRTLQLPAPATLNRLGVRRGRGYHKCGSHAETDWVTACRVLVWNGTSWQVVLYERDIPRKNDDSISWFDLGRLQAASVLVEIRQCEVDSWWSPWNLCADGLVLEGEAPPITQLRGERVLRYEPPELGGLPPGITASHRDGEVRYRSQFLELGFCLRRAGLSYLSVDDEGRGRTSQNLLRMVPGVSHQGLFLHPLDAGPVMASSIRYWVEGSTRVRGNCVEYEVRCPESGQTYRMQWEVYPDRLVLTAERIGERDLRAWESSTWTIGFDPRVSAVSVPGRITRIGESGILELPVILHAPAFGSFEVRATVGEGLWRTDTFRHADLSLSQLKLGEEAQPEGDYLLRKGEHRATLELSVRQFSVPLRGDTPVEVARALRRCSVTALSYRADTGTLSNNGNSIHCPLSMDNWSALATRLDAHVPELNALALLRDSVERWLDGGPGYGSGGLLASGKYHVAEDEYIMTGTAALLGTADFLDRGGTQEWLERYGTQLARQIALMRGRDVDGDGLVESTYRLGISGQYQWSTCFYDVISFGWKCAFSNALLYPALVRLARTLPRLGRADLSPGLDEWAALMKSHYLPTFYNPATGWLAGWRCREGKLHDHAFITVNGVAVASEVVDVSPGLTIMQRLWQEAQRVGLPDPQWGLPANLWPVPDDDLAEIQHGFAFGYYANGGLTTAQTRHVAAALFRVGMTDEGEFLLRRICKSLGEATVFGGSKSGIDGRTWDGWPCGYEGILTDQFGILAVAMDRYAVRG